MKTKSLKDIEVATFKNCRTTHGGKNQPIPHVLRDIMKGKWAAPIRKLRDLEYGSGAYQAAKTRLPCFMLSASTTNGGHKATDIGNHTGLLQIDIDGIGQEDACTLREKLEYDPHVLAAWLSPSGQGLKAAMLIPDDVRTHKIAFETAEKYFLATYGQVIDRQCSDPCRLCFVSYDPDLRLNASARPLEILSPTESRESCKAEVLSPVNSSTTLHTPPPPEPVSTTASASYILHNNSDVFSDFPALKPFYERHVVRTIGSPQRGLRNEALTELVAGLFCIVHPRFIMSFARVFYDSHPEVFADYAHEQYVREVEAMLAGCTDSYPRKWITPSEATVYDSLESEEEKTTFRICRSLAALESDASVPPPTFFLPSGNLGVRLGTMDMQAWRVLKKLEQRGIIAVVEKGQVRRKVAAAKATVFKWMLVTPEELTTDRG